MEQSLKYIRLYVTLSLQRISHCTCWMVISVVMHSSGLIPLVKLVAPCEDAVDEASERGKRHKLIQQMLQSSLCPWLNM